jgi:hypothetical protein
LQRREGGRERERERENSIAHSPREVVRQLLVVKMMVVKLVVRVLVVEGHGGERERRERNFIVATKMGGMLIFFFIDFGLDFPIFRS